MRKKLPHDCWSSFMWPLIPVPITNTLSMMLCSSFFAGDHKVGRYGGRGLNVLLERGATAAASEGSSCFRPGRWGGSSGRGSGWTTSGEEHCWIWTQKAHTLYFLYVVLLYNNNTLTCLQTSLFLISSQDGQEPWAPCQVQMTQSTWNIRVEAAKPLHWAKAFIHCSSASESRSTASHAGTYSVPTREQDKVWAQ